MRKTSKPRNEKGPDHTGPFLSTCAAIDDCGFHMIMKLQTAYSAVHTSIVGPEATSTALGFRQGVCWQESPCYGKPRKSPDEAVRQPKSAIVDILPGILVAFVIVCQAIPRRIRQNERPRLSRGLSYADGRKTKAIAIAHLQQIDDGPGFESTSTFVTSGNLE